MTRADRFREARAQVRRDALRRYLSRQDERNHVKAVLAAHGPGSADSPQRQGRFGERMAGIALARSLKEAERLPIALERIMGPTVDFTPFAPNEAARKAGHPVARIVGLAEPGIEPEGFATGFLIGPGILLTNHHVFPSRGDAAGTGANFLYERTERGLQRGSVFETDPDRFYVGDEKLDFAAVAVKPRSLDGRDLAEFGQVTLIEATPKILRGQPVNIIQHPEGGPKQYAVEQNRLVDILETEGFLHYETDTLEGSSGSPAYSRDWELVALHHAAIPLTREGWVLALDGSDWSEEMGEDQIRWIANEGVRVSTIVARLASMTVDTAEERRILTALLETTTDPVAQVVRELGGGAVAEGIAEGAIAGATKGTDMTGVQLTFTGPVTINIQSAPPGPSGSASAAGLAGLPAALAAPPAAFEKTIRFDPDYDSREGYDPAFLDRSGAIVVPVPTVAPARLGEILNGPNGYPLILKYHHFELVMNSDRRLQMWSAANVDYDPDRKSSRDRKEFGRDKWVPDPRIPASRQIFDADFYKPAGNIDRGHMVRREDNAWGDSEEEIEFANSDTFHWTNCTPQHEAFNQSEPERTDKIYRGVEGIWGALENHIQKSRTGTSTKVCLLAGPILDPGDPVKDFGLGPVQYPLRFWKVVCIADDDGAGPSLSVFAFILDQTPVVNRYGIERFGPGRFKKYQVPLTDIEGAAGIVFDPVLHAADTVGRSAAVEIARPSDIVGIG
ncbi:MAG TPA: DNA/RNA non-specific endonuclease [Allosphingosinicella sp.]